MRKLIAILLLSCSLQTAPAQVLIGEQIGAGAVAGTIWGMALPNYAQVAARLAWKLAISYLLQDDVMEDIEYGERNQSDLRCNDKGDYREWHNDQPITLKSPKDSFRYPADFVSYGKAVRVVAKNPNVRQILSSVLSGKWVKVYLDGYLPDKNGNLDLQHRINVSIHYFLYSSGVVAMVNCVKPDDRDY